MLKAGQTILLPKPGLATLHLWVVAIAPDSASHDAVIVNFSTQRHQSDNTVVLQPGDHPFVQHATVVFFADARLTDARHVAAALNAGTFQSHKDCSPALLLRIQKGLLASPYTSQKIKDFARQRLSIF